MLLTTKNAVHEKHERHEQTFFAISEGWEGLRFPFVPFVFFVDNFFFLHAMRVSGIRFNQVSKRARSALDCCESNCSALSTSNQEISDASGSSGSSPFRCLMASCGWSCTLPLCLM